MTRFKKLAVALLAGSVLAGSVDAAIYPVDDSASQVLDPRPRMQWESVAPVRNGGNRLTGQVTVLLRLQVAPWLERNGRVFMTLPARPEGPISATWVTRGVLQPGRVQSGERALIYAGRIRADRLEDTLTLTLTTDGTRLTRQERLDFRFFIEVDE